MPLSSGTRLGPYEISAQIGVGGMGEVYKATDTNLKRQVAVKVLPDSVAADAERLARFQREAEVLAALNHPNIAQIHGLEKSDGTIALVMELVEGPTLADRITQGAIPVDEAVPIARQIAEALEAAHEQGIVHRDLKPANIKVRPDGTVKVLDFGLAKAMEPASAHGASAGQALSQSPTITTPAMTQAGIIIGTAAYMSPEQARGKAVDRRADIWAFGVVLFEMLAGQRAFEGEDVSLTLAAVLRAEVKLDTLPVETPARVRQVLATCLQRDLKQRIGDIHDVRLALDGAFETAASQPAESAVAPVIALPLWRRALPFAATGVAAVLVTGLAALGFRPAPSPRPVVRSVHGLPEGRNFRNTGRTVVTIAPDGQYVVYNATGGLYLRRMDTLEDHVIPGTEAVLTNPVYSPDGREVGYWQGGQLKRIAASGGVPVVIGPATNPYGMSWEADGTILFGQPDGIWRVAATGGTPELVIPTEAGERASSPQRLPGGDWVLFTLARGEAATLWDEADIVAASVSSGERRVLRTGGTGARYVPTGHLVYAFQNVLYAVPFDVDRVAVAGGPVPVVQGVRRASTTGDAFYAFATDGTLAYVPGTAENAGTVTLGVTNRAGQLTRLSPEGTYDYPRVSPDGRWVAFTATYSDGGDIAVYELGTDTAPRRLTFGGRGQLPIWSADSRRVIFSSARDGAPGLYWQLADGTGAAERLTTPRQGEQHVPDSASPDGERVAFTVYGTQDAVVWVLMLQSQEAEPLVAAPGARIDQAVFSSDGRWLAYQSNETGPAEIFVQPFPTTGAKYQLSNTRANHHPLWSPDGRELFYVPGPGQFAVVSVAKQPRFTFGNPVSLTSVLGQLDQGGPTTRRRFDMMPDGAGFLSFSSTVTAGGEDANEFRAVHIVQNWTTLLRK